MFLGHVSRGIKLLCDQLEDCFEIRVTRSESAGYYVSAARDDRFAIDDDIELARFTRRNAYFAFQTFRYKGRETRSLRFIVSSGRTIFDFDIHKIPVFIEAVPDSPAERLSALRFRPIGFGPPQPFLPGLYLQTCHSIIAAAVSHPL